MGDQISDLKLGNGSSVLITANIASSLPASVGAALTQAASKDSANLGIYGIAFLLTTLGVVYVQEAERQIPMNYSSAYRSSTSLSRQAYLPFKVSLWPLPVQNDLPLPPGIYALQGHPLDSGAKEVALPSN